MMLGEESQSATYWKKCGDEALANGIEHVVMMVHPLPSPNSTNLTNNAGSTLGRARRRNRNIRKPETQQISSSLCASLKVRALRPKPRPPNGIPRLRYPQERRLQC